MLFFFNHIVNTFTFFTQCLFIQATYDTWIDAMQICRPGLPYNAIGEFIEDKVATLGYKTIRGYTGHGIGKVSDFSCY